MPARAKTHIERVSVIHTLQKLSEKEENLTKTVERGLFDAKEFVLDWARHVSATLSPARARKLCQPGHGRCASAHLGPNVSDRSSVHSHPG